MPLTYENLDSTTREFMLGELDADVAASGVYMSQRLSSGGQGRYVSLLREAMQAHDDAWLAAQLRLLFNPTEVRRTPNGGTTVAKVPVNAADTLAEGEFNRYYARGVCARALAEGRDSVEVYRGRISSRPRPESEALIGQRLDARRVLDDLRSSQGTDTFLGVPGGPNSGITIRLA